MNMCRAIAIAVVAAAGVAGAARASETDQFMTWGVELEDSAPLLNARLNAELDRFLEKMNRRTRPIDDPVELTRQFYYYLSKGLFGSRFRAYIQRTEDIDRYPALSVGYFQYLKQSVFRDPAFPFILPLTRTIRIGDVYLGTDKVGHFFSFGRRYYQRYQRSIDAGLSEEEAMERVVRWGIAHERYTVGGLVDGIVSKGDLEANFQGFLLARDLCGGEHPYVIREGRTWKRVGDIDLAAYVTPDFDESYNVCVFTGVRKKQVPRILQEEYCSKRELPEVEARFRRYVEYAPSFSQKIVDDCLEGHGYSPAREALSAICSGDSCVTAKK